MAQHNRTFQNEIPDSASLPVVHITATNTGLLNVNTDIMIVSELGYLAVFDGNVFDGVQDECGVLCLAGLVGWRGRRDGIGYARLLWLLLRETFCDIFWLCESTFEKPFKLNRDEK